MDDELEQDTNPDIGGADEVPNIERAPWAGEGQGGSISIETGRGNAVLVDVGAPFMETIERQAQEANYGGYFRVFLNGQEIIEPTDSPEFIESGQRIAITSYDKVG